MPDIQQDVTKGLDDIMGMAVEGIVVPRLSQKMSSESSKIILDTLWKKLDHFLSKTVLLDIILAGY